MKNMAYFWIILHDLPCRILFFRRSSFFEGLLVLSVFEKDPLFFVKGRLLFAKDPLLFVKDWLFSAKGWFVLAYLRMDCLMVGTTYVMQGHVLLRNEEAHLS